eukprot:gene32794-33861_t
MADALLPFVWAAVVGALTFSTINFWLIVLFAIIGFVGGIYVFGVLLAGILPNMLPASRMVPAFIASIELTHPSQHVARISYGARFYLKHRAHVPPGILPNMLPASRMVPAFIASIELTYPLVLIAFILPTWHGASSTSPLLWVMAAAFVVMPIMHAWAAWINPGYVPLDPWVQMRVGLVRWRNHCALSTARCVGVVLRALTTTALLWVCWFMMSTDFMVQQYREEILVPHSSNTLADASSHTWTELFKAMVYAAEAHKGLLFMMLLQHETAGYCNRFDQGAVHNCLQFWTAPKVDWWSEFEKGDREMMDNRSSIITMTSPGIFLRIFDIMKKRREKKREQYEV